MKKTLWLLFILIAILSEQSQAQSFVFSCAKDTVIPVCTSPCITVKALIPDIHESTSDYTVNSMTANGGCFNPYVDPSVAGISTSITIDDRYSNLIDLPFSFPFYDDAASPYNGLVVSTNGYLSFDPSKANTFSHFGILSSGTGLSAGSGTPQDLPNTKYDASVVMGPYHDINPAYNTSPDQLTKYDIIGNAPHRKFILSYYKIPLFSCRDLINNTHQIVLYEGTGIIEVFIFDIDQCASWNDARSMIGLQNYNKDKGIMAPGRAASDPVWGSAAMNESWRFVPSAGPSTLDSVVLTDLNGNIVSVGSTLSVGDGNLEVSFPDVCPNGRTTYIVKSKYKIPGSNPVEYVYGTDTLTVFIPAPLNITNASVTDVACPQGNSGAINIAVTGAPGNTYSYTLNGGIPQSTGTFSNLSAGTYQVHVEDVAGLTCPKDTTFQVIDLAPNFTVEAGQPVTIISGEQIQLNGSSSNASSILWTASPSDPSLSATTSATPSVSPMVTTTYTLTATNSSGCVISDNVEITVIPRCINVRNAFSPNGDGINDYWKVYDNRDCLQKVTVSVFNRNGSKVFESKDYKNEWNGTFKNKILPDATYYAVVEFFLSSGKRITSKSDVTILR